jgi:hypothetical protein
MRLPINPFAFLGKLLVFFALTYAVWHPLAPYYAQVLLRASRLGLWITELSFDPVWRHATDLFIDPSKSLTAIFYVQRNLFLAVPPPPDGVTLEWLRAHAAALRVPPQGIPAEWIMANLVLLIPLMLATPAPTWRARFTRLGAALAIALVLQVFDVIVAIKAFYASNFRDAYGPAARQIYQFLDAFVQSWDTQLFPFAIWAGVHFRLLLPRRLLAGPAPAAPASEAAPPARAVSGSRAERRRRERAAR